MFDISTTRKDDTFQAFHKSSNGRVQKVPLYRCQVLVDHIFQFRQIGWTVLIHRRILISPQPKVYWSQIWRPRRPCILAKLAIDSHTGRPDLIQSSSNPVSSNH
ncbi:hypothetical protein TNCV_3515111 [Trichonephila clavipes]|nr:hypothetical protein TNCV_3515111 [Trichonephila clavipes]